MKISLLVIVILLMTVSGCRDSAEQPLVGVDESVMAAINTTAPGEDALGRETKPPRQLSRDEMVIRNCYLTRDAAEEWSRENGGGYPYYSNENIAGHTLFDLLPGGQKLVNPYYPDYRNMPAFQGGDWQGTTEYLMYCEDGYGLPVGYMITGWGEEGELVRIVHNWPDSLMNVDSLVVANCIAVRQAAEKFAVENGGVYPSDLGDETPVGNTMIDFLPGGRALRNPITSVRTEPVNGAAATCGQSAYSPSARDGINRGYCITGIGRNAGVTIITICKHPDGHEPYRAARITVEQRN